MRTTLSLLALLVLSSCAGPAPDPFTPRAERGHGANQIIVTTQDPPDEAYATVVRLLAERGYNLASSNEAARVVTTEPKPYMGQHAMRVTAIVAPEGDGSHVTLRGSFKSGMNVGQALLGAAAAEDPERPIEDRGQGGSPMKRGFDTLEELAAAYPGGTLTYARVE